MILTENFLKKIDFLSNFFYLLLVIVVEKVIRMGEKSLPDAQKGISVKFQYLSMMRGASVTL